MAKSTGWGSAPPIYRWKRNMRNYERLDLLTFGRRLIVTGDLDPVYIAAKALDLKDGTRHRFLCAYTAFYHVGVACFMSQFQGREFWEMMMTAAENIEPTPLGTRWPRAKERRHFRGEQATKAIQAWQNNYGDCPEQMYGLLGGMKGWPVADVISKARSENRSVGEWMAFKMADLTDALVADKPLKQDDITPFLYETPRKSLLRFWREQAKLPDTAKPKDERVVLETVLAHLAVEYADLSIPHKQGQPLDMFALETVACKHLSHLNGHYPLLNDIDEIREGLEAWVPQSHSAEVFLAAMPDGIKQYDMKPEVV